MFASIVSKIPSAVGQSIRTIGAALSQLHWALPAIAIVVLLFI